MSNIEWMKLNVLGNIEIDKSVAMAVRAGRYKVWRDYKHNWF